MIQISGKVVQGQRYGRILGFPTANLDRRQYLREKLKVKFGVWAGTAIIEPSDVVQASGLRGMVAGRWPALQRPAAIVIGPIDKTGRPKIEAHLINFKGNLYGKKVIIILKKYIRSFKQYKNVEILKNQIQQDINQIKKLS